MAGLVPFNRKGVPLRTGTGVGFENFYNMLDDFFGEGQTQNRNLFRDTFKIDIEETEKAYLLEAELPGVKKEEVDLGVEDEYLRISVNRQEETRKDENGKEGKNYIHRERRISSMSRRIHLANVNLNEIKAKLEEGILTITIPKEEKMPAARKIDIE